MQYSMSESYFHDDVLPLHWFNWAIVRKLPVAKNTLSTGQMQ